MYRIRPTQVIKARHTIDMSGVARWKVYSKEDKFRLHIIKRFFTLNEAREFVKTLDYPCVIAYD